MFFPCSYATHSRSTENIFANVRLSAVTFMIACYRRTGLTYHERLCWCRRRKYIFFNADRRKVCHLHNFKSISFSCPWQRWSVDSAAVSIFVVILVELTNTVFVFVNSTNITTNFETAVLYMQMMHALFFCLTRHWILLVKVAQDFHYLYIEDTSAVVAWSEAGIGVQLSSPLFAQLINPSHTNALSTCTTPL